MISAKRHRGAMAELYRSVIHCSLMCASLVKRRTKRTEFVFYIELFTKQMLLGTAKRQRLRQRGRVLAAG